MHPRHDPDPLSPHKPHGPHQPYKPAEPEPEAPMPDPEMAACVTSLRLFAYRFRRFQFLFPFREHGQYHPGQHGSYQHDG